MLDFPSNWIPDKPLDYNKLQRAVKLYHWDGSVGGYYMGLMKAI